MTPADQKLIAARRKELEEQYDEEAYGMYVRIGASRQRVGSPASARPGKRTAQTKMNYRKTMPATAAIREREWGRRSAA